MTKPGRFITLEGVDGAGKSTHLGFVADWLRQQVARGTVSDFFLLRDEFFWQWDDVDSAVAEITKLHQRLDQFGVIGLMKPD